MAPSFAVSRFVDSFTVANLNRATIYPRSTPRASRGLGRAPVVGVFRFPRCRNSSACCFQFRASVSTGGRCSAGKRRLGEIRGPIGLAGTQLGRRHTAGRFRELWRTTRLLFPAHSPADRSARRSSGLRWPGRFPARYLVMRFGCVEHLLHFKRAVRLVGLGKTRDQRPPARCRLPPPRLAARSSGEFPGKVVGHDARLEELLLGESRSTPVGNGARLICSRSVFAVAQPEGQIEQPGHFLGRREQRFARLVRAEVVIRRWQRAASISSVEPSSRRPA